MQLVLDKRETGLRIIAAHVNLLEDPSVFDSALSDTPVGVDIEYLPAFAYDVAEPFEWTKMESVGKLLGCGVGPFIGGVAFQTPAGITVRHIELDEHFVCIACAGALPLEATTDADELRLA